jgi:hypothetical protein
VDRVLPTRVKLNAFLITRLAAETIVGAPV